MNLVGRIALLVLALAVVQRSYARRDRDWDREPKNVDSTESDENTDAKYSQKQNTSIHIHIEYPGTQILEKLLQKLIDEDDDDEPLSRLKHTKRTRENDLKDSRKLAQLLQLLARKQKHNAPKPKQQYIIIRQPKRNPDPRQQKPMVFWSKPRPVQSRPVYNPYVDPGNYPYPPPYNPYNNYMGGPGLQPRNVEIPENTEEDPNHVVAHLTDDEKLLIQDRSGKLYSMKQQQGHTKNRKIGLLGALKALKQLQELEEKKKELAAQCTAAGSEGNPNCPSERFLGNPQGPEARPQSPERKPHRGRPRQPADWSPEQEERPQDPYERPEVPYERPQDSYESLEVLYERPHASYERPQVPHGKPEVSYGKPQLFIGPPRLVERRPYENLNPADENGLNLINRSPVDREFNSDINGVLSWLNKGPREPKHTPLDPYRFFTGGPGSY